MRLLIIDDNPADRELVKRAIGKSFEAVNYVEVIHQQAFEEALQPLDYEIVFTDYRLKWSTGIEVLKAIRARSSVLPVIMVTDTGNEEIAAEAMKQGLNDYVLKTHLYRLPLAIKECLERVQLEKERQDLQAQIQQAQKMESLGLLVSGIAHDFNNLLAAIVGYAELGMRGAPRETPLAHEYFEHIHQRAKQGARMTRQLLAFARGTAMEPTYLNVNEQITAHLDFLRTLLGTSVQLDFEAGQGTGLGLAMVYGIIKQHHGTIQVQSQPGQGTTFSLYMPAVEHRQESVEEQVSHEDGALESDGETILLVEDDPDIQLMMTMILEDAGYTVIVARDGEEGVSLFEAHSSSIALVIADIMMPKMKGRQFQEQVSRLRTDIKVLVVSGYKGLQYVPRVIITDKLKSCGAEKRGILPGVEHRQHPRVEQSSGKLTSTNTTA